ncbi:MAG: diguanylate cyclase [Acidobacteria bacterium ADurb.Bin340]|nr:MAG: diguanylate cyclase [Acidobacteria bacterium ADurb.Bin340]
MVARQVGSSDPAGLAERIRRAVAERPFELGDGRVIHMTLSIGFSPFPLGNQVPSLPWEKVVLLADRALYAVKRTGRNGWIGLDEGPAFDADILLASGGHPDIPGLLDQSVLHVVSSFPGVPKDAWI